MGVSKAILESVIFCHQDDSHWPLSENTKLKAKFDNIFAATRYRAALESIKKQRKTFTASAKEQSLKLETVRANRTSATRVCQLCCLPPLLLLHGTSDDRPICCRFNNAFATFKIPLPPRMHVSVNYILY
jgi:hypothetical protein